MCRSFWGFKSSILDGLGHLEDLARIRYNHFDNMNPLSVFNFIFKFYKLPELNLLQECSKNLQRNDFRDNVNCTFKSLREDSHFADVTLACEDGQR